MNCECLNKVFNTDLCAEVCTICGTVYNTYRASFADNARVRYCAKKDTSVSTFLSKYVEFDHRVGEYVNKLYCMVTENQTFRGERRRSVMIACLTEALRQYNKEIPIEQIAAKMEVKNTRLGTKVLESYLQKRKMDRCKTSLIDTESDLKDLLSNWSHSPEVLEDLLSLYQTIKDQNDLLYNSKTRSLAAAILYYYTVSKKKCVTLQEIHEISEVSPTTIKKLYKLIKAIQDEPGISRI